MDRNLLLAIPNIESDEMLFIDEAIRGFSESQQKNFIIIYQGRRKDPQTTMICCIIGYLGVAGLQRFILGQVGMGILYFLTGGLCLIGTTIDLINYRRNTLEYNQKVIVECKMLAKNLS